MIGKLYTKVHSLGELGLQNTADSIFTAEEHALVVKKEMSPHVSSRESLLNYSLHRNVNKLETFPFLVDFIRRHNIKSILSVGAGDCTLEHLLACCLSDIPDIRICATEFDSLLVESARKHYPNIRVEFFDLYKNDIVQFQKDVDITFDLVVFYGSAYVMDNDLFRKQFRRFRDVEVKYIVDFHAGYLSFFDALKTVVMTFVNQHPKLKKRLYSLLSKSASSTPGKFHGYWRDRLELERLYQSSGWKKVTSFRLPHSYGYIGILTRSHF